MDMEARYVVVGMGLLLMATVLVTGCIGYPPPGGDLDDSTMEDFPTVTFTPGKIAVKFHENVTLENATKVVKDLNSTTPEDIWVDEDEAQWWDKYHWLVVEVPVGAEEHYIDLFELENDVVWADRW